MSRRVKLLIGVLVVLIVAIGLGFAWGAAGRRTAEQGLEAAQHQLALARQALDLAEARGHVLDARVSLYNMNFGDAQRQLEDAKAPLGRARDQYQTAGKQAAADAIAAALAHVEAAQGLAGRLDQAANSEAGEALTSIQAATSK